MDGINPNEPTRAAAASLRALISGTNPFYVDANVRKDVAVKIRRHHHVEDSVLRSALPKPEKVTR